MRSERRTAEQTALAGDREQSGEKAGMTDYSSRRSVGDRLPRWICISPEHGRVGTNGGNGYMFFPLGPLRRSSKGKLVHFVLPGKLLFIVTNQRQVPEHVLCGSEGVMS